MENLILMQQVHGNNVVTVGSKDAGTVIPDCDAIITNDPKVTLGVRVADCLPISVTDKKSRTIGLIHAGWRGLEQKIIEKTLQNMIKDFSSNPKDLEIVIGPHICAKHYEVKADVSSKFSDYPGAVLGNGDKVFLDLAKVAKLQLLSLGIKEENIKIDERCTFEDKKFFSFRRDRTEKRNLLTL